MPLGLKQPLILLELTDEPLSPHWLGTLNNRQCHTTIGDHTFTPAGLVKSPSVKVLVP